MSDKKDAVAMKLARKAKLGGPALQRPRRKPKYVSQALPEADTGAPSEAPPSDSAEVEAVGSKKKKVTKKKATKKKAYETPVTYGSSDS